MDQKSLRSLPDNNWMMRIPAMVLQSLPAIHYTNKFYQQSFVLLFFIVQYVERITLKEKPGNMQVLGQAANLVPGLGVS